MISLIITLVMLFALNCASAQGSDTDPHLGAAVHFENPSNTNYNAATLPAIMAKTPIAMIRDGDAPNWKKYEQVQGQYIANPYNEQAWIDAMAAAGYSIVFCSGFDGAGDYTPAFYAKSPFPIQQYCAFISWFVGMEEARGVKIAAIEVQNEPNNNFASIEGSTWRTQLVQLSNAVADAVHAVDPNLPVIGLGAQGQDIINMLAMTPTHLNGVVYHPYDAGSIADNPEAVFEGGTSSNPPAGWGFSYPAWVSAIRAAIAQYAPGLQLWETECGPDAAGTSGWGGEVLAARWMTRRLVLTKALAVEHTFFYQLSSGDATQSLLTFSNQPRTQVLALNRLENAITGKAVIPSTFSYSSSDPNVAPNALGYLFSDQSGNWGAVTWVSGFLHGGWANPSLTAVTFPVPNAPQAIAGIDLVTGEIVSGLQLTSAGSSVTVNNVPMGPDPILLVPAQATSSGPRTYNIWLKSLDSIMVHYAGVGPAGSIEKWIAAHPITPDP